MVLQMGERETCHQHNTLQLGIPVGGPEERSRLESSQND